MPDAARRVAEEVGPDVDKVSAPAEYRFVPYIARGGQFNLICLFPRSWCMCMSLYDVVLFDVCRICTCAGSALRTGE